MVIFIIRNFNDLDHMVPVIYKYASVHDEPIAVFSQSYTLELESDFRIQFLKQKFSKITVDYLYHAYKPTILHKLSGSLIHHDDFRKYTKETLKNIFQQKQFSEIPRAVLVFLARQLVIRGFKKVYSRHWVRSLFHYFETSLVVMDHGWSLWLHSELREEAAHLGIPVMETPHGLQVIMDLGYREAHESYAAATQHRIVPFQTIADYFFSRDYPTALIHVLGSPRFCAEWGKVYDQLIPKETIASKGGKRRLKVVYMDSSWLHTEAVQATFARLAELDWIDLKIKPRTRELFTNLDVKDGTFEYVPNTHSNNLIQWADVVIATLSSIVIEVFLQKTMLLFPRYFTDLEMIFESYDACAKAHSCEELEQFLRQKYEQPDFEPYPQENVDRMLSDIIYNGDTQRDVLGEHVQLMDELQGRV